MTDASHNRSIVVWDVPTAITCGESFAIKVGVKCQSECQPDDWSLAVRDHEGAAVAATAVGNLPWPETTALYYCEIALVAPDIEGLFGWEVVVPAVTDRQTADESQAAEAGKQSIHEQASARFNIRTVPEADCRLSVVAIDRESQAPVPGLKVVVHPYRALTDEHGIAELKLPQGQYRLFVSGKNFFPFRLDGELTEDQTIRAELVVDLGPSDAELWS